MVLQQGLVLGLDGIASTDSDGEVPALVSTAGLIVVVFKPVSIISADGIGRVLRGVRQVGRYAHMEPDFLLYQYGRLGISGFSLAGERPDCRQGKRIEQYAGRIRCQNLAESGGNDNGASYQEQGVYC